jgi:hypothetical protein
MSRVRYVNGLICRSMRAAGPIRAGASWSRWNSGCGWRGWCGVGCGVLLATGCTEFKPGTDAEDSTRGALLGGSPGSGVSVASGDAWDCLDDEPVPVQPRPTVSYTVTVVDSITNQPPPGLSVQACDDIDINCARPVTPRTGVSSDGRVRLSLAQGFDGFFEVTSDNTVPTRLYPDGTLRSDEDGATLELIDEETVVLLAQAGGVELQPDAGSVLARAFDCNGQLSSGIEFENDTDSRAFAFIDGLPIEGKITGGEGLILFANVPAGFTFIEGTLAGTSRQMGTTTAESRPGWVVYADVRPPP